MMFRSGGGDHRCLMSIRSKALVNNGLFLDVEVVEIVLDEQHEVEVKVEVEDAV